MSPKRTDGNQAEIMKAFRDGGCYVIDLHVLGRGVPDLLVCKPGGGLVLVEVKSSKEAKFTPDEIAFAERFPATVYTVTSVEDVKRLLYHWSVGL